MEEVYIWFKQHAGLMHRFLEATNNHVAGAVEAMMDAGIGPNFVVGDHMLLSGNIPSPYFPRWTRGQVEESVRDAIRSAAAGGGFTLRTTGGTAGTNAVKDHDQLGKVIGLCETYLTAGLKYGQYPIRV